MALNPAVQKKAQAELDTVVGSDRFPDHSDKESLPYVHAVVKEALRWQNAMPFSLPHLTSEDMEYRGYFIPRGTVLSPQTWYALCNQSCVPRLLLTSPRIYALIGLAYMMMKRTPNRNVSSRTDSYGTEN